MSISIELRQCDIGELTMERWATVGPDGLWSTSDGAVSITMNIEAAKGVMYQIEHQVRNMELEQQRDLSKFNSMRKEELIDIAMRIRQTPQ